MPQQERANILEDIQKTPLLQETRPGLKESKIVTATTAEKKDTGAAQCPIKDIPAFDPEFWDDLGKFKELDPKKMKIEEPQQPQEVKKVTKKGGKKEPKRKLSLKKKGQEEISE